jgi:DNA-binding CsgD family transcriptional regulator/pimeloyl-ACP methyl ester carboxylesterase
MEPIVEFATSVDGTRIAWAAVGDGPTLILMPGVPLSDLEAEWRIPTLRRAFGRLAERVRLIQYDGRGTGRSQRDVADVSLEAHLADLDAVIDAAGMREVVLLGFYHSAMTAIAWAARRAARTRGLILFGGAARGWDLMSGTGTQALISLIERDWDTFAESATHAWLGWPDDSEGRLAADLFRTSTSPVVARATLQAAGEIDVTADAASIRAPALVLHRRDAAVIPLRVSTSLASAIPNGHLEIMSGSSASLFFERTDVVVDRLIAFTRDPAAPADGALSLDDSPTGPTLVGGATTSGGSGGPTGPAAALSPRERQVLSLIAEGDTNGQIAAQLGISINTVERHVSNVYRKIDARGRADATAWAIRNDLA